MLANMTDLISVHVHYIGKYHVCYTSGIPINGKLDNTKEISIYIH